MAIIGRVEKKNWKVKVLNLAIHLVLILGATTMVYPLLLMISGSLKSSVDFKDFDIVPQYFYQDTALFKKYINTKYNTKVIQISGSFKEPKTTVDFLEAPVFFSQNRVDDYAQFLAETKQNILKNEKEPGSVSQHFWFSVGGIEEKGVDPYSLRTFRAWLQQHPDYGNAQEDSLKRLNTICDSDYKSWDEVYLGGEDYFSRRSVSNYQDGLLLAFKKFKMSEQLPALYEFWPDIEGEFIAMLRRDLGYNLPMINQALNTRYNSWQDITVPSTVPTDHPMLAKLWEDFVKEEINLDFISLDVELAMPAWKAFLLHKYGSLEDICKFTGFKWNSMDDITLSATSPGNGVIRTDWSDFVSGNSSIQKNWKDFLKKKYVSVDKMNQIYQSDYADFAFVPAPENNVQPKEVKNAQAWLADAEAIRKEVKDNLTREVPAKALKLTVLANHYRSWLEAKYKDINALNIAYGNGFKTFQDVPLNELPSNENNLQETADWEKFASSLEASEVGLTRQSATDYKTFIKNLYTVNGVCNFEKMSADYKANISNENEIPAYDHYPADSKRYTDKAREDYCAAILSGNFNSMLRINDAPKYREAWQKFLQEKYNNITALNRAWKLEVESFAALSLPTKEYEWNLMQQNKKELKKEFIKRNYTMVLSTLFTNGNAAFNTLLYCFLSVAAALLVNPLCAYGLSRYKPASSYKILLFLMLPMAFPAMVLGIPQFLLIKNLGLLNTFAALILPGMANGYSIFLLKGFFDSLPKELFESAAIDGASEWTVFWHIAMSLSTPILSVIALGAFTGAYGNFMMAFLLCQKESMWTMMVYLYQLQQRASESVGFAALIIAAVPTLIVFIFCQNIIIKGIVVPTEK